MLGIARRMSLRDRRFGHRRPTSDQNRRGRRTVDHGDARQGAIGDGEDPSYSVRNPSSVVEPNAPRSAPAQKRRATPVTITGLHVGIGLGAFACGSQGGGDLGGDPTLGGSLRAKTSHAIKEVDQDKIRHYAGHK
jgi:hypothetical protein